MSFAVIFTPRSERHLQNLLDYITERSGPRRAEGYVDRIVDHCLGLHTFPERGHRRDDIRPGLRTLGFERRVTIAFSVEARSVVIHGVYYGGQNFEVVLRDELASPEE
jgi:toxin ParE1/3/4